MNFIPAVIMTASPLLLITLGALISEYAGRLAMFMEAVINLGAFFCYFFSLKFNSVFFGIVLSVLLCTLIVFILDLAATKFKANVFLISIAINLLLSALWSFLSAQIFGTRGVLYDQAFNFSQTNAKIISSVFCYAASFVIIFMLYFTRLGLKIRITGRDSDVLASQGNRVEAYKMFSWIIAASTGALAGSAYAMRISSFVPGMAGGRGWTALAAVFLGRRNPLAIIGAVFVFALSEYLSTFIQNVDGFKNIPSSVLLALPYIISLLLILLIPHKKQLDEK
ncbi:MAG: ABC transporter permease [Treponema sp.]|nr:ABC transporter permease [Treponema sp.]